MNYNNKLNAHQIWDAINDNPIQSTSLSSWAEQSTHAPSILIAKELLQHSNEEILSYRGGRHGINREDTLLDIILQKKNKFLFSVLSERGLYLESLPDESQFIFNHRKEVLKNNYEIYKGHTLESFFYEVLFSSVKNYREYLYKVSLNKKGYQQPDLENQKNELAVMLSSSWIGFLEKTHLDKKETFEIYQVFAEKFIKPQWKEFLFNEQLQYIDYMHHFKLLSKIGFDLNIKNNQDKTILDCEFINKYSKNKINDNISYEKIKNYLNLGVSFNESPSEFKNHLIIELLNSDYNKVNKIAPLLFSHCSNLHLIEEKALNILKSKNYNQEVLDLFNTCVEKLKLEEKVNEDTNNYKPKKIRI